MPPHQSQPNRHSWPDVPWISYDNWYYQLGNMFTWLMGLYFFLKLVS